MITQAEDYIRADMARLDDFRDLIMEEWAIGYGLRMTEFRDLSVAVFTATYEEGKSFCSKEDAKVWLRKNPYYSESLYNGLESI